MKTKSVKYLLLTLLVFGATFVLPYVLFAISFHFVFYLVFSLSKINIFHLNLTDASIFPFLIPPILGLILALYIIQLNPYVDSSIHVIFGMYFYHLMGNGLHFSLITFMVPMI